MSFNKVILVGNLGKDPELRYTQQGDPVCSFTMATNERKKDRTTGENQDVTTWFRVTLFGRQAETASQYLTKGRPVYIEGRLRMETYTDKQGQERTSLEVRATDMQFIGTRGEEGSGGGFDAGGERGGGSGGNRGGGGGGGDAPRQQGAQGGGGGGGAARPAARPAPEAEAEYDDSDIPF